MSGQAWVRSFDVCVCVGGYRSRGANSCVLLHTATSTTICKNPPLSTNTYHIHSVKMREAAVMSGDIFSSSVTLPLSSFSPPLPHRSQDGNCSFMSFFLFFQSAASDGGECLFLISKINEFRKLFNAFFWQLSSCRDCYYKSILDSVVLFDVWAFEFYFCSLKALHLYIRRDRKNVTREVQDHNLSKCTSFVHWSKHSVSN